MVMKEPLLKKVTCCGEIVMVGSKFLLLKIHHNPIEEYEEEQLPVEATESNIIKHF
jgi:hypothetical protein